MHSVSPPAGVRRIWAVLARTWRGLLALVVDAAHSIQGLATRDRPRTQHLFHGRTAGAPMHMLLTRPGHIEDELLRSGLWEPHVAHTLSAYAKADGTVVDVGANIGYHGLYVALSCPGARVVCYEPNPVVHAELVRNAALNPTAHLDVRAYALSNRAGVAEFHAQSGRAYNRGSSGLRRNSNMGARYETISVEVRTLDDELGGDRVDLMKIDTEGFEASVLGGARQIIARCRPVVVFEFDSRFLADPRAELASIRGSLPNYTFFTLEPGVVEPQPFHDHSVARRYFRADVLAIPDEGAR